MQPNQRHGRIDDIEALRAVAILFTLIQHVLFLFPWENHFLVWKNNYVSLFTGVDLFFAVSGFVIGRDLLSRLELAHTGEAKFRVVIAFWIRRVYRIWPTSMFWLTFIAVVSAVTTPHLYGPLKSLITDASAIILQVYNFRRWECTVGNVFPCGDTAVWWSLSLEEQFYIFLPLAIFVFRKKLPYALGAIVLVQIFLYRPQWSASILWWIRTDAISLAVLLAIFSKHPFMKIVEPTFLSPAKVGVPVVIILIVLLATSTGGNGKPDPAAFSTGLIAVISVVLVFIASFDRDYILRPSVIKPLVLWLGARSYAMYLIHYPMLAMTRFLWKTFLPVNTVIAPNYTLRLVVTWLILVGVLAEANFRFIETPLRKKGRKIASSIENARLGVQNIA